MAIRTSHSSLYKDLIWLSACKTMLQEISYLRMVASFWQKLGMVPMFANSSSIKRTGYFSRLPGHFVSA